MDAILLIPWDAPSLLAPKNLTPSTVSSAANATNESGGEAEIAGGGEDAAWGRDAEFTEHSRGVSQRSGAKNSLEDSLLSKSSVTQR